MEIKILGIIWFVLLCFLITFSIDFVNFQEVQEFLRFKIPKYPKVSQKTL